MLLAFPIGFLYPLISINILSEIPVFITISFTSTIFISILILLTYNKLKIFYTLEAEKRLKIIKKMTCHRPVIYLIMILFVCGESVLIYSYSQQKADSSAAGATVAMIPVLFVLYIMSLFLIEIDLCSRNNQENHTRKLKYQISISIICAILLIIFIVLISALVFLGISVHSGLITGLISFLLISLLAIFLIQLKYSQKQHGLLFMTIANSTL